MDSVSAAQDDIDSRDYQSNSPGGSDNEQDTVEASMASTDALSKNGTTNGKPNPKDPNRPRRKKARRACFACQRAHLTCGMY